MANKNGTVTDSETGVVWADRDNGGDINWEEARKYCAGKDNIWQLPTVTQLQTLHDASGKQEQICGVASCRVTPLIRLSGSWVWSNEPNGSSEAWYVTLGFGDRNSVTVGYAYAARALCVRRS